jgi:choline dehydrogenase-like flavoprotein
MNGNNADGVGPTPSDVVKRTDCWGDELLAQIKREFGTTLSLSAGVDQLPDEKNTVTLDPENKDYFGLPIPLITYRFDEYTQRGLDEARRIETEILGAAGAKQTYGPEKRWWPGHHMGTTRMGDDPRKSVVDRNCRTHDVPNLYLSGSSVYVTGGVANPTLTIAALALRLGDYLGKRP